MAIAAGFVPRVMDVPISRRCVSTMRAAKFNVAIPPGKSTPREYVQICRPCQQPNSGPTPSHPRIHQPPKLRRPKPAPNMTTHRPQQPHIPRFRDGPRVVGRE